MFSIILVIAYLGYYGMNQSNILLPEFLLSGNNSVEIIKIEQRISPFIENKETRLLKQEIELIFEKKEVFLDENLSLNKLAKMLGITDKKLSSVLNKSMNISFYDYVNEYRVEAIKAKLESEDYNKYTLLGLAYECGFNSKASFNRIFKKKTGKTPSQYRKSVQKVYK